MEAQEKSPDVKPEVKAIFIYYSNNKNSGRDEEIYKRWKANFPQSFRLILIATNEASERLECIYPRYIVADDLVRDLNDMSDYIRKALQLDGADETKKKEILKVLGYEEEKKEGDTTDEG